LFVKSADNDSDIYTKNLGEELFNKHSKKYIETLEPIVGYGKGVGKSVYSDVNWDCYASPKIVYQTLHKSYTEYKTYQTLHKEFTLWNLHKKN